MLLHLNMEYQNTYLSSYLYTCLQTLGAQSARVPNGHPNINQLPDLSGTWN